MNYRIRDWNEHFENNRSREIKRMDWVPMPNKMDGSGYAELLDHPNGAAHFGAWVAIVEIASRRPVRGELPHGGADICRVLWRMSRIPAVVFEEAIPRLLDIQWIEEFTVESRTVPQDAAPRARALHGTEGKGIEGKGTSTTRTPDEEFKIVRQALVDYSAGKMGNPDDALVFKVLKAARGAPVEEIGQCLKKLHASGKRPESWGWFPTVVAAKFSGRPL